jgi:hypothetical protein
MTDLEMLDAYGPAAKQLRTDVLDRARLALLEEAANEPSRANQRLSPSRRSGSRRRLVAAGLLAASVAGAAVLLPSTLGLGGASAIALASVDPLTFPLTPQTIPPGLTGTHFELDSGFQAVRYVGNNHDRLSVTISLKGEELWSVPDNHRPVDIGGRAGVLFDGTALHGTPAGTPSVSVVWQDAEGAWTRVTGEGSYADATRVESFAESLRRQPQRVDLSLRLAPRGWSVDAYKEDRVLTMSPDAGPAEQALMVSLVDAPSGDITADFGAHEVTTARVHGRDASMGKTDEGWIVLAETSSRQWFSVSTPTTFTREQVIEVANGVSYTP